VKKAFDPFFTTKEVGKGTGLGLATVYGIVKQNNGHVTIYSEPGVGTTFTLYLPVVDETADVDTESQVHPRGGTETILIAEDNAPARRLLAEILRRSGYTVVEAVDGLDAVRRFKEAPRIDLLIADSVMPGKNGREAYDEIRGSAPDIRVLFTSGYTKDIVLSRGIEDGAYDFLMKPVSPDELLAKVRQILDR
jgi:CheY-like chemotaxis protein